MSTWVRLSDAGGRCRWRDRCVRVGHLGPVLSGAAGSHALGMGAPRRDGESAVASPPTCKLTPPNSGPGAAAGRERARERSPGAFPSGATSPFPVSPANGRLSGALSFSPSLPTPGGLAGAAWFPVSVDEMRMRLGESGTVAAGRPFLAP